MPWESFGENVESNNYSPHEVNHSKGRRAMSVPPSWGAWQGKKMREISVGFWSTKTYSLPCISLFPVFSLFWKGVSTHAAPMRYWEEAQCVKVLSHCRCASTSRRKENLETLGSSPGICKGKPVGNNRYPGSLENAEIPFSVIPFLNLIKITTNQILGNCHFPYSIGSFITMAVQLFFRAKQLQDFSIILTQMILKTWGSLGTA